MANFEIKDFRDYDKNTLKGFFTLRIVGIGLEIRDCTLHENGGKRWIGLPSKPWVDKDGNTVRDEEGKAKYTYIVKFYEDEKYYQMQEDVLKLMDYLLLGPATKWGPPTLPQGGSV